MTDERVFAAIPVEYRAAESSATPGTAVGYAAVFGKQSHEMRGFREVVAPTAFKKTLAEADVMALWNHDESRILGRVSSGTLRLSTDDTGLRYEVDLPDTTTGRDLAVSLARGDIRGSSFQFRSVQDAWEQNDDGTVTRTLLEVRLIDVSPVTRPAYPDSTAAIRSLAAYTHRDIDEVRAAFAAHDLSTLLTPDGAETTPPEPIFNAPLEWLYA